MSKERERRCIVARAVLPEARLVRMALSPDGEVTPDLAAKLPGRGAWVEATRGAVETAVKKKLFARAFERSVDVPPDLADRVENLLAARCLAQLGLARRAGAAAVGFDQVRAAVKSRGVALLIEARDGAADGRGKVLGLAKAALDGAPVAGCFTAEEIGAALGRGPVGHVSLSPGPHAAGFAREAARLDGFRALTPPEWSVRVD